MRVEPRYAAHLNTYKDISLCFSILIQLIDFSFTLNFFLYYTKPSEALRGDSSLNALKGDPIKGTQG